MSLLGSGSVHVAQRYAKKPSKLGTPAQVTCQRCLQQGHYTYQCTNAPVYQSRPSRTKQLLDPKRRQAFMDPSQMLPEMKEKPKDIKKHKRKRSETSSSSSSSESSSGSDSSSSSSDSDSDSSSSDGSSSSSSDDDSSSTTTTDSSSSDDAPRTGAGMLKPGLPVPPERLLPVIPPSSSGSGSETSSSGSGRGRRPGGRARGRGEADARHAKRHRAAEREQKKAEYTRRVEEYLQNPPDATAQATGRERARSHTHRTRNYGDENVAVTAGAVDDRWQME